MIAKDVLFYTIALAIAVFTAMAIWGFVAMLRILRTMQGLVDDFRQRLKTIDEILQTIHSKLTSTHAELTVLAGGVRELISFFINRRAKRRSSTRASSDKDD